MLFERCKQRRSFNACAIWGCVFTLYVPNVLRRRAVLNKVRSQLSLRLSQHTDGHWLSQSVCATIIISYCRDQAVKLTHAQKNIQEQVGKCFYDTSTWIKFRIIFSMLNIFCNPIVNWTEKRFLLWKYFHPNDDFLRLPIPLHQFRLNSRFYEHCHYYSLKNTN